jgi:hypothetical protein
MGFNLTYFEQKVWKKYGNSKFNAKLQIGLPIIKT